MRRCSVKPYEGQENYIFVSYCHKDKAHVFPVIEQLARDGHRVWYDEGIDPGSEWPEIIAHHLSACSVCLAFISQNSLNSHNCRREINFALLKKKTFISVIIEPVQMSLGMEMQLSSAQSIFKYKLPTQSEFFEKLYSAQELKSCLSCRDDSILVSKYEDYINDENHSDKVRDPFSDKWFTTEEPLVEEYLTDKADEKIDEIVSKTEVDLPVSEPIEEVLPENSVVVEEVQETNQEASSSIKKRTHVLKREKTNEIIEINKSKFVVGRSETKADYIIVGNSSITREHCFLYIREERCYIEDNNSLNKTYVNGKELCEKEEVELKDGDVIKLYNEKFIYCLSEVI